MLSDLAVQILGIRSDETAHELHARCLEAMDRTIDNYCVVEVNSKDDVLDPVMDALRLVHHNYDVELRRRGDRDVLIIQRRR